MHINKDLSSLNAPYVPDSEKKFLCKVELARPLLQVAQSLVKDHSYEEDAMQGLHRLRSPSVEQGWAHRRCWIRSGPLNKYRVIRVMLACILNKGKKHGRFYKGPQDISRYTPWPVCSTFTGGGELARSRKVSGKAPGCG